MEVMLFSDCFEKLSLNRLLQSIFSRCLQTKFAVKNDPYDRWWCGVLNDEFVSGLLGLVPVFSQLIYHSILNMRA